MVKKPGKPLVQRIKEWRTARGLSQSEAVRTLAEAGLPIKLSTLQQWEIGRRSPQPVTAFAIERFLAEEPRIAPRPTTPSPIIVRLKRWREENNFTRGQAVEVLTNAGLPVKLNTLQRWEAGERRPSALAAKALQNFLDQVIMSESREAVKTQTRKRKDETGRGPERNI